MDYNSFEILNEATRNQLMVKSRKGASYKNASKGNRWTAKSKSKVANTVKDYNKIDMDTFWKKDQLQFKIKVEGETDTYFVTIEFNNILEKIQRRIKDNKNKLEIKCIYDSLLQALNSSDVKVDCTCPDFKYRFRVWATKNNYNAGESENREAKITNPSDNLGAACKHILCALNNAEWLQKIASVINNYINYCKDNMEYNYSRFIFPKLYGMTYRKAIQMTIDDYDDKGQVKDKLDSDEALINLSNALGKDRGKIKKGSNKNPVAQKEREESQKK